ncbi:glycoside hydrolase family 32 protein [Rhodococcus erythropolis]
MHEQLARAEKGVRELLQTREDRWYPKFHIAAQAGWINDPNGLSHFNGRYQTYFQHHPYGTQWGPMHWGHVSSEDLVTWRREPIALAPSVDADRDGVFSGSAVVSDDGKLIVYYTGHRWRNGIDEEQGNLQVQCMAVSEDGVTFEKKGVIVECPDGLLHFRDPKVWREAETWYMIFGACSAANRGEVWLYTSIDMVKWDFDRVLFQDPNPEAFMLECPDMFPLGADRYVLVYCPMGPSPDGYQARNMHNAGYVVGRWTPGEDFEQLTAYRPIDWGHNYYAPQTFQAPDGRRIMFAWMGSFTTAVPTQEDGWCGQLTVPRELTLGEDNRLRALPIAEFTELRENEIDFGAFELAANHDLTVLGDADAAEILLDVDLAATTSERVGLHVHATPTGRSTVVAYDDLSRRVTIDRSNSGHGDRGYRSAPHNGDRLKLRVLIDRGSVEVFVGDGVEALTSFAFPETGSRAIRLSSEAGTVAVNSLKAYRLGTIWEEADR